LVITFDDGWKSNYELLHIFRKYKLPVTIFLTTGLVNTNRRQWNSVIELSEIREDNWLKTLLNSEKDKYLFEKYGFFPEKEYRNRSMLNLEEIGEMKHSVDFQSHGVFHPVFIRCSQSELEFELTNSKEWLEKTLDIDVYGIAYPYGWINSKVVTMTHRAGYSLGRTANFPCLNSRTEDPLKLKCVGIKSHFSLEDIERKISRAHINTFLLLLQKYSRRART
jgi:peptidoglycan/xylan/chitin deacetylase (PgdA/CDA1 family)